MEDGAERQAVVPGATEVRDVDIPVADRLVLTPFEQGVPFRAAVLDQAAKGVFALRQVCHAVAAHEVDRLGVQSSRVQQLAGAQHHGR